MTESPPSVSRDLGPLIGAIDQGTSSTRFLVFSAATAELVTFHEIPTETITPRDGWAEQDPDVLYQNAKQCIEATVENLRQLNLDPRDICAIGVTNQRETVVAWDKDSGQPLHNAILWMDTRAQGLEQELLDKLSRSENAKFCLQHINGLPFSSFFSALKLKWLLSNVKSVQESLSRDSLKVGTIDSWLIWKLTGGSIHVTDVTNASRTMLMNISSLEWDEHLLKFFNVPRDILPDIRSCSEILGRLSDTALRGVPISGCIGDQQAALVGQGCLKPGQSKCTYGTGCFVLSNIGAKVINSEKGLICTVAYKMGKDSPTIYALESPLAMGGGTLDWLKDKMKMINDVSEVEALAANAKPSANVHVIPSLTGLLTPQWQPEARGSLFGLDLTTGREEICQAVLEAIAFHVKVALEAIQKETKLEAVTLLTNGKLSNSDVLMQLQANMLGIPVLRTSMIETTGLGAAILAGSAPGIEVWDMKAYSESTFDRFLPCWTEDERNLRAEKHQDALTKSLEWQSSQERGAALAAHGSGITTRQSQSLISSISFTIFAFTSLLILKFADTLATSGAGVVD